MLNQWGAVLDFRCDGDRIVRKRTLVVVAFYTAQTHAWLERGLRLLWHSPNIPAFGAGQSSEFVAVPWLEVELVWFSLGKCRRSSN